MAESFYGVMESQRQKGRQSNDIIELRSLLDFALPTLGPKSERLVEATSADYMLTHDSLLVADPRTLDSHFRKCGDSSLSKVLYRLQCKPSKLPYLE